MRMQLLSRRICLFFFLNRRAHVIGVIQAFVGSKSMPVALVNTPRSPANHTSCIPEVESGAAAQVLAIGVDTFLPAGSDGVVKEIWVEIGTQPAMHMIAEQPCQQRGAGKKARALGCACQQV